MLGESDGESEGDLEGDGDVRSSEEISSLECVVQTGVVEGVFKVRSFGGAGSVAESSISEGNGVLATVDGGVHEVSSEVVGRALGICDSGGGDSIGRAIDVEISKARAPIVGDSCRAQASACAVQARSLSGSKVDCHDSGVRSAGLGSRYSQTLFQSDVVSALSGGGSLSSSSPSKSWSSCFGTVLQKENDGVSVRVRDFSNCTSVFLGNIPPLMSIKKIWAWFSYFGVVVDVFRPQRRSKIDGSCFAFVRFKAESDAIRACDKVNGLMLDGFLIVANIARFARLCSQKQSDLVGFAKGDVSVSSSAVLYKSKGADLRFQKGSSSEMPDFCKISFAEMLKSGGKSEKILNNIPISSVHKVYAEDPGFLEAVISNNYGSSAVENCDVSSCVSVCHLVESSSVLACSDVDRHVFSDDACCVWSAQFSHVDKSSTPSCRYSDWALSEEDLRGCSNIESNGAVSGDLSAVVPSGDARVFGENRQSDECYLRLCSEDPVAASLCSRVVYDSRSLASMHVDEFRFALRSKEVVGSGGSHPIVVDNGVFHLASVSSGGDVASSSSSVEFPNESSDASSIRGLFDVPVVCGSNLSVNKEVVKAYAKFSASVVSIVLKVCKESGLVFSDRDERTVSRLSVAELLKIERMELP